MSAKTEVRYLTSLMTGKPLRKYKPPLDLMNKQFSTLLCYIAMLITYNVDKGVTKYG